MPTIEQLKRSPRTKKRVYSKTPGLNKNPQKKGVCTKVYTKHQKNLIQQYEKLLESN